METLSIADLKALKDLAYEKIESGTISKNERLHYTKLYYLAGKELDRRVLNILLFEGDEDRENT